jgi:sulfate adenylyltransferase subunit 1 (EFTu-like GTPase family)
MLSHAHDAPWITRRFAARLAWMDREPLVPGQRYLLKHGTQAVRATVEAIDSRLDLETLDAAAPTATLAFNDLGRVRLTLARVIAADAYTDNRATGAFILVDEVTHRTVAGGMIEAEPRRG